MNDEMMYNLIAELCELEKAQKKQTEMLCKALADITKELHEIEEEIGMLNTTIMDRGRPFSND